MKTTFTSYRTLSGEYEYLMNKDNLPRQYRTLKQAEKAIDKVDSDINFPTKIIKSISGKLFFIVKNTELINYEKENKERFSGNSNFLNYLNGN